MSKHDQKLTPMTYRPQNTCFGCGPANVSGLHLEFFLTESRSVVSMSIVPSTFEGYPGYVHGGIIAALLDEAMGKSVHARGGISMTRHIEIDYMRPVPSSVPLRLEARITHNEGRKHWSEAKILNEHGTVLAQSKGLFVEVSTRRQEAQAAS